MTDAFANASAALAASMAALHGQTVTYARGDLSASVTAWLSTASGAVVDAGGAVLEYESWDWTVPADAISEFVEPKGGDRITAADGKAYEVMPPLGGDRAFLWLDSAQTLFLVHAKKVEGA
jgi:hypothetical protein